MMILIVCPFAVASGASSTQGYVSYQVTLNHFGKQTLFVVNESASVTNQKDLVNLSFNLVSSLRNLSYSRVVNTSSVPEVFPFVPGITNQSFSYQTHGLDLSAQVSTAGSSAIAFQGKSYQASKYLVQFSVTNSSNGQNYSGNGTMLTLPSGLLYSVELQSQQGGASYTNSLLVQLLSTSLPLNDSPNPTATTEGAAMIGAGVLGAAAIAVPWKFRTKKIDARVSSSPTSEVRAKPEYWVD